MTEKWQLSEKHGRSGKNKYLKTIEKRTSKKVVSGGQRENKNKVVFSKNPHYI